MADDRRATIEAAFDTAVEAEGAGEEIKPIVEEPAQQGEGEPQTNEPQTDEQEAEPKVKDKVATPAPRPDKAYAVDKPPMSWRPQHKAKWDSVDPEIRQEVMRREREIDRGLSESASARQLSNAFHQTVQPYMARIQSYGVHPMVAVQELLKSDHILSTAPKTQRAAYMAELIKTYGIDIEALDAALSGQQPSDNSESRVEALLQERLKPFMAFMQNQTAQSQAQQEAQQAQMAASIDSMANDPKYSEFDNVREDMADIIDLQAKKGVYLSLEQAYTRAIAMNPEVSQRVRQQTDSAQRSAAAKEANAKALRALSASKSVNGAPSGNQTGVPVATDRRATIEAAWNQLEGR